MWRSAMPMPPRCESEPSSVKTRSSSSLETTSPSVETGTKSSADVGCETLRKEERDCCRDSGVMVPESSQNLLKTYCSASAVGASPRNRMAAWKSVHVIWWTRCWPLHMVWLPILSKLCITSLRASAVSPAPARRAAARSSPSESTPSPSESRSRKSARGTRKGPSSSWRASTRLAAWPRTCQAEKRSRPSKTSRLAASSPAAPPAGPRPAASQGCSRAPSASRRRSLSECKSRWTRSFARGAACFQCGPE
mmetsp:Transcript_44837/g.139516  ORF Transcript_44837/g.139516 Transcript_44837/m.139516 type:complete len:251 (-) Transcript_44837:10-762(-)